jgi:hypothetical protein
MEIHPVAVWRHLEAISVELKVRLLLPNAKRVPGKSAVHVIKKSEMLISVAMSHLHNERPPRALLIRRRPVYEMLSPRYQHGCAIARAE